MQLHSAVTSSSSLTGTPDDVPQLPVGQAPGSPGAVTRSARLASLHRAPSWRLLLLLHHPGSSHESVGFSIYRWKIEAKISVSVSISRFLRIRLLLYVC